MSAWPAKSQNWAMSVSFAPSEPVNPVSLNVKVTTRRSVVCVAVRWHDLARILVSSGLTVHFVGDIVLVLVSLGPGAFVVVNEMGSVPVAPHWIVCLICSVTAQLLSQTASTRGLTQRSFS
jgi:hypothetical protein